MKKQVNLRARALDDLYTAEGKLGMTLANLRAYLKVIKLGVKKGKR